MPYKYWHDNKHIPEFRDRFKSDKLKSRYGISLLEYNQMVDNQNGLCKICEKQTKLHVDHSHKTGQVRGLLCHTCNNGLGCFKDNPDLVKKAHSYLEDWLK